MEICEVENASFREGKYVIKVKKHKTMRKHGPAMVCCSPQFYQEITAFVQHVRSKIASNLKNVFITYYGKVLESGAISKQINSLWQRCGVYGEGKPPIKKNISSNIFRKSGSTIIEDQNPSASPYVASLLAHSEATSKMHYRLTQKEIWAIRGTKELEKTLRSGTTTSRLWTEEMIKEVEMVFGENISQKNITIHEVRKGIHSSKLLSTLSDRQVLDKIRSYWRCSGLYLF